MGHGETTPVQGGSQVVTTPPITAGQRVVPTRTAQVNPVILSFGTPADTAAFTRGTVQELPVVQQTAVAQEAQVKQKLNFSLDLPKIEKGAEYIRSYGGKSEADIKRESANARSPWVNGFLKKDSLMTLVFEDADNGNDMDARYQMLAENPWARTTNS